MFQSVRWRLTAWNVFILTAILVVLGVAFYLTMKISLLRHEEDDLYRASDHIARGYLGILQRERRELIDREDKRGRKDSEGDREDDDDHEGYAEEDRESRYQRELEERNIDPEEPLTIMLVWSYLETSTGFKWRSPSRGAAFFPYSGETQRVWRTERTLLTTKEEAGETILVLTSPVKYDGKMVAVVQSGKPITGIYTTLRDLLVLLLIIGLAGVILATLGGLFLAERALIPIRLAFRRQVEFVADASHELRTPLSIIRTSAEMLDAELKDTEAKQNPMVVELMDNLLSESERMGRLVSDLLTLARADSHEAKLNITRMDTAPIFQGIVRKFSVLAEKKGIKLLADIPEKLEMDTDPTRLEQLLVILCDNAIKYTGEGGQVRLSVSQAAGKARISVSDSGVGIPAEHLPRIFDRFYRVDKARSREQGGTGLGLSIAKWITDAHEGTIEVTSEPGKGTTFTVTLPITKNRSN